jgi:hypothetical protein
MAIHLTPEANPTIQEGTLYVDSATGEFNVAGKTTPHIIPGVLYPAVAGKLLDGSTSHSGNYGTAQTDGRKYYYTDIKGSKPIKDPRIGGHFGSQRHKTRFIQLLEQETATHGENVYSVDGKEWFRAVGPDWLSANNAFGHYIYIPDSATTGADFVEIVGYFNAINMSGYSGDNNRDITLAIDGTANSSNFTGLTASVDSPLSGTRYVDGGSVVNLTFDSAPSLGIHTVKIGNVNGDFLGGLYGIELIAQDTSNRNNIQIPSQNVVSYGKKFTVSAEGSSGHHYDPFNGFTSGSSVSSYVDTATSLGLDKWLHSSNYYRPYNGGRVVKWVDSSGVIKTSVTLMPPNAKSIADSSSLTNGTAKANASASNDTFYPTFEAHTTDVNEDNLHEVAKTFHVREFGNGSANGGTGATYADASMVNTAANQDVAFVMDDGLTSFSADNIYTPSSLAGTGSISPYNPNDHWYVTFIGTGVTSTLPNGNKYTIAQNLPFGTHIIKAIRGTDSPSTLLPDYYIDGVELDQVTENFAQLREISFHQPKKPPIPEDACVLADYMLMADTVSVSGSVDITSHISKGVRRISSSRDFFYDASSGTPSLSLNVGYPSGIIQTHSGSINGGICKVPYFGTNYQPISMSGKYSTVDKGGSTNVSVTEIGSTAPLLLTSSAHTLGLFDGQTDRTSLGDFFNFGAEIATPIHTSFHYQSFETPFLHELVGGDRNMEQTNLVVSPDGKTWDEVTRDTSYLGNLAVCTVASGSTDWGTFAVCDAWRGTYNSVNYFNKYFAIAYDRLICLVDGQYEFTAVGRSNTGGSLITWNINGTHATLTISSAGLAGIAHHVANLKKGDVVAVQGEFGTDSDAYNVATIKKV